MIKQFLIFLMALSIFFISHSAQAATVTPQEKALIQKILTQIGPSVYTLYAIGIVKGKETNTPIGSAVAVSSNALATNCHVALAYDLFKVKVANEMRDAETTYQDSANDLCIVNVTDGKLTPAHVVSIAQSKIGDSVFAIGCPNGLNKTISQGKINNILKEQNITLLQTDVTILEGSNGGGLFDLNGNLIGILTEGIAQGENINFAIPADVISAAPLPELKKSAAKDKASTK